MNDDNVRHLWSDAELDEALDALHPHVRTDPAELDRARATLLRAASAETGQAHTAPPAKKRSGTWRWIAVAAAVVVVTGGVVVAREIVEQPATVAPAATATADVRPGPGQYTHVTNTYTDIEWVADRSAFAVQQKVEFWIPADRSDMWMRKWTRDGDPVVLTGQTYDKASLPGPDSTTQIAAGGDFRTPFPYPGGWDTDVPGGWYRPTPAFVENLPTDSAALLKDVTSASSPPQRFVDGATEVLPPMQSYPGLFQQAAGATTTAKTPLAPTPGSAVATYAGPGDIQMRLLTVLASGLAPRPVRAAIIDLLRSQATTWKVEGDTDTYLVSYGNHQLVIDVDNSTSQLLSARDVTNQNFYGIHPGETLSTAKFSFEITSEFGS
ncbi:hypothetical protein QRX50_11715 [Amycolatopsis carbonis]|uniref:CU044_5270 family protein n=1 Tax=Amycolatopsis carbonis TaxID=715471 RepID=A0A9Y2MU40_9PSEU|nr:hypothetical protein [Amycolatopsis sp. 2-15]WIX81370.1 hypothetical protein QRX50_11715 [Amycolatopsis sp. 2-15]